jgi:hypothetical protein
MRNSGDNSGYRATIGGFKGAADGTLVGKASDGTFAGGKAKN